MSPLEPDEGLEFEAQVIAGRYQVLWPLGQGGMGRVVAARNLMTERIVALKIARASVVDKRGNHERFLREARAASMLSHANVIDVLDVVIDARGAPVIVMELLEGLPLSAVLAELGRLSLAATARCLVPTFEALRHAHAARLVHRDVKPSNVFLARQADGTIVPKLLDFGIVKVLLDASMAMQDGQTATGALLGTPHYMSPEQVSGQRDVDERSDVWAAGTVAYECLSGVRSVHGDNFGQVFAAILMNPVTPLAQLCPELPEAVEGAIMAALTRDREQRPADVSDLLAAMRPHAGDSPAASPSEREAIDALLSAAVEVGRREAATVTRPAFASGSSVGSSSGSGSGSIPGSGAGHSQASHSTASRREEQVIEFCQSADGVRIAYSSIGSGPPIVWAPYWLSHLELNWRSPLWRSWLVEAARDHRLISFDQRGTGLSDWGVEEFGPAAWLRDLEAVVEAAGLGRFVLVGFSQGCVAAISYAAKHPERVSQLVLQSGLCRGWRQRGYDDAKLQQIREYGEFVHAGWGRDDRDYRERVIRLYMKDGTEEEWDWFNRILRSTTSASNAREIIDSFGDIDVSAALARVRAPTLVIHGREDPLIQLEHGEAIAAGIAGSRLVVLDSGNHILRVQEPAWDQFWTELRSFLGADEGTLLDA